MTRVGFLTAHVWLEDGRLWFQHDCLTGTQETALPTTWRADADGNVTPSIHCLDCGLHYMAKVEQRDQAWYCGSGATIDEALDAAFGIRP